MMSFSAAALFSAARTPTLSYDHKDGSAYRWQRPALLDFRGGVSTVISLRLHEMQVHHDLRHPRSD